MKNKTTVISFLAVLYTVFFLCVFRQSDEFSSSERRRLAQFPEFSISGVLDGSFMSGFDDYAVDQIAFREPFRRLKANFDIHVLRKLDNNGIFIQNGIAFKTEYPLNERSVVRLSQIINMVTDRYLDGMNVWYSIVPDKNYYLKDSNHLILDYSRLESLARQTVSEDLKYIDLFGTLTLEDYFRTDSHWRQERLSKAAETLAAGMGVELEPPHYTEARFDRFYGVFYGQAALDMEPDTITWRISEVTENAVVTAVEKPNENIPVYDLAQLDQVDPYSLFMGGPTAFVTARNPLNDSGRELVIFRDSFASSVSPLLLGAYSTITMIDLRYMNPEMIPQLMEFGGQDVLFLYSTAVFNVSDSIRAPVSASRAFEIEIEEEGFISPFVKRGRLQ